MDIRDCRLKSLQARQKQTSHYRGQAQLRRAAVPVCLSCVTSLSSSIPCFVRIRQVWMSSAARPWLLWLVVVC